MAARNADTSFDFVPDFNIDSAISNDQTTRTVRKRRKISNGADDGETKKCRGRGIPYAKEKEFETREAAEEFLKSENIWSKGTNTKTKAGVKKYFRCNRVPHRGKQCPASVYLLFHSDRHEISLFRSETEHDHSVPRIVQGIAPEVREKVFELADLDGVTKPHAIKRSLEKRGMEPPTSRQLSNALYYHKLKTTGGPTMDEYQFVQWCQQRSTTPSADEPDRMFVIAYSTAVNEEDEATIQIFASTRRLLEIASRSTRLHVDATYKLNYQRMPVFVIGTTDQNRVFHPFGIGVTKSETADDFAFFFKSLVDGIDRLFNDQYRPQILVADAALAITKAFRDVFGPDFTRVYCWFHMKKNVESRVKKIKDPEHRERILDDIDEMQRCESVHVFDAVVELFHAKWSAMGKADIDSFLTYFFVHWVAAHKGWFEGFAPNCPSTNNALEATNLQLKIQGTHRDRLPLPEFLTAIETDQVERWSKERNPTAIDAKIFATTPTKYLRHWKKALEWAKEAKRMRVSQQGRMVRYYIPADSQQDLDRDVIASYRSAFRNLQWQSFDEYAVMRLRLWVVTVMDDDLDSAACTCHWFLKHFECKHVLGIAITKGEATPPPAAIARPIAKKKKSGRTQLATAALIRD